MSWESNPAEQPEPVKDRTKLLWGIVIGSVVIMAALLALNSQPSVRGASRAYVKHIYIPFDARDQEDRDRALELVTDIRQRIVSGELSFEDAASEYSADSATAKRGGHLGWIERDDLAKGKARQFVWEGPVGELSTILQSGYGFHLIYVDKRELSAREQYERDLKERVLNGETDSSN